jgi:hypothetical protein
MKNKNGMINNIKENVRELNKKMLNILSYNIIGFNNYE